MSTLILDIIERSVLNMGLIKNVTTGAIIGAAAGMMIAPQLNRNTRKRLRRSSDMMMGIMGDIYDDMMKKMR
jgi:gas vesicle protein